MRRTIGLAGIAVALVAASPVLALEKTSARVIDRGDEWNASTTGTIRYYNNCTGWVWVWSGWSAGETVGVSFTNQDCSQGGFLATSWTLTFSGVPSGYGFTGTIQVAKSGCGTVLASQPYLPPVTSGWQAMSWSGLPVPAAFSMNVVWAAASGFTNGTGLASDHPLAGPTGPAACGTCFPTTRVSNSRYYGIDGAYCPSGTTLSDGLCDIEFFLDVNVKDICDPPIGVKADSWATIKAMYR